MVENKHQTNHRDLHATIQEFRKTFAAEQRMANLVYIALVQDFGDKTFSEYQKHQYYSISSLELPVLEGLRNVFKRTVEDLLSDEPLREKHKHIDELTMNEILCTETYQFIHNIFRHPPAAEPIPQDSPIHEVFGRQLTLEQRIDYHLAYLFSSEQVFRVFAELENFTLSDEVTLGPSLSLRKIGLDDYAKIKDLPELYHEAWRLGHRFCNRGWQTPIIEILERQATFSNYGLSQPRIGNNRLQPYDLKLSKEKISTSLWRVLTALRIFQDGDVEIRNVFYFFPSPLVECWVLPPPPEVARPLYYQSKEEPKEYNFTEPEDHRAFQEFWKVFDNPAYPKRLQTALRRFGLTYQRRLPEDELIDLVVCLESLFSTDSEEVAYKTSLRATIVLSKTGASWDRLQLFRFLKRCYSLRSELVHGLKVYIPDSINLVDTTVRKMGFVERLRRITREAILYFLRNPQVIDCSTQSLSRYYDELCLGAGLSNQEQ